MPPEVGAILLGLLSAQCSSDVLISNWLFTELWLQVLVAARPMTRTLVVDLFLRVS